MKNKKNNKICSFRYYLLIVVILLSGKILFALPGVKSYIPDTSGEYIYYRDYTFSRESYIGFLYYNDSTYAARYYAPADPAKKLPERTVTTFFTIDPKLDYVKFTGEKFLSITTDDTEIVNYLHNLMFELDKQRKNIGPITPTQIPYPKKTINFNDYGLLKDTSIPFFGGKIFISYDYLVPIFNIKKIENSNKKTLFVVVTGGILTSGKDNSFNNFKGFFNTDQTNQNTTKLDKKAKKTPYNCLLQDNGKKLRQSITIDANWTQSMDNLWFLGNTSLLSINFIKIDKNNSYFKNELIQKALLGTENSYSSWENLTINLNNNQTTIKSVYYQYNTNKITNDTKIISLLNKNYLGYFVMTTFNTIYTKNKNYFDSIVSSYKTK